MLHRKWKNGLNGLHWPVWPVRPIVPFPVVLLRSFVIFKDWESETWGAHVDNCEDFKGRFKFIGDYENHKCGIRLADMRPEESGEWKCILQSYYDESDWVEREFQVTVTTNYQIGW